MDLGTLVGALVGILGVAGGVITFFITWGKLNQRADDQDKVLTELRKDVDAAQSAASQVQGLADAIEHLTREFSAGLAHIGEMFNLNNSHINTQLTDIKDELKHVRANRALSESAPRARRVS